MDIDRNVIVDQSLKKQMSLAVKEGICGKIEYVLHLHLSHGQKHDS